MDTTVEVGEDPNVKIFRAHMNILCYSSPYLRRALVSKKKNDDDVLAHIKLSNISPEIFQIILNYIYGGILSFNGHDTSDYLKVLAAADKLHLQETVDYLQKYLIKNKSEWMEQHFEFTQRISFQSNNLLELQQLFQIIKRDDLQMNEIEVWEHVLKYGLAQNPTLLPDPDSEPNDNILLSRNIKVDGIIDSKIVNLNIVSIISRRIDKVEINSKFAHLRGLYLPYKFELLLRGSRDGFTPEKFHTLCDGKHNTITFIKVKGTEEILGGHNPIIWLSNNTWGITKDSLIRIIFLKMQLLVM